MANTLCGEHLVMYVIAESLHCTPEINISVIQFLKGTGTKTYVACLFTELQEFFTYSGINCFLTHIANIFPSLWLTFSFSLYSMFWRPEMLNLDEAEFIFFLFWRFKVLESLRNLYLSKVTKIFSWKSYSSHLYYLICDIFLLVFAYGVKAL